ncbi:MAG: hypothetical protein EOR99_22935 [Mesorhizobium sp.]|nr:MAG: hypothetical protein EOR99_22935 [Mesorhizobium sp.]
MEQVEVCAVRNAAEATDLKVKQIRMFAARENIIARSDLGGPPPAAVLFKSRVRVSIGSINSANALTKILKISIGVNSSTGFRPSTAVRSRPGLFSWSWHSSPPHVLKGSTTMAWTGAHRPSDDRPGRLEFGCLPAAQLGPAAMTFFMRYAALSCQAYSSIKASTC